MKTKNEHEKQLNKPCISFLDSTVSQKLIIMSCTRTTDTQLTGAIFETGAYGVPSKSPNSFICGGVIQTINLKSPGKGAPPSTPSWGLQ